MCGEMAERSKAAVLKSVIPVRVSWVRIPLSPISLREIALCSLLLRSKSFEEQVSEVGQNQEVTMKITTTHLTKQQFQDHIKHNTVFYDYYEISASLIFVCATKLGICEAILCDKNNKKIEREILQKYPKKQPFEPGQLAELVSCPVIAAVLIGTDFQVATWQAATKISAGTTISYHELAQILDNNKAHRAVANALAQNRLAYFIPCHRIIRKDGSMGGYKWGVEKKLALLDEEKNYTQKRNLL